MRMFSTLPRGVNGYLICSNEDSLWLHCAKGIGTRDSG